MPRGHRVMSTSYKFDTLGLLSTSEFARGNKAQAVGAIGHAPEVKPQAAQDEDVYGRSHAVPDAEGVGGLLLLRGQIQFIAPILDFVELSQAWLQPEPAEKAEAADRNEQPENEPLQRFAEVKALRQLMEQRNRPAPVVQDVIAAHYQHGQAPRKNRVICVS